MKSMMKITREKSKKDPKGSFHRVLLPKYKEIQGIASQSLGSKTMT